MNKAETIEFLDNCDKIMLATSKTLAATPPEEMKSEHREMAIVMAGAYESGRFMDDPREEGVITVDEARIRRMIAELSEDDDVARLRVAQELAEELGDKSWEGIQTRIREAEQKQANRPPEEPAPEDREAEQAERQHILDEEMRERGKIPPDDVDDLPIDTPGKHVDPLVHLPRLMSQELAISSSEGRRLIHQGGVKLDGKEIKDTDWKMSELAGKTIRVGKRRTFIPEFTDEQMLEGIPGPDTVEPESE